MLSLVSLLLSFDLLEFKLLQSLLNFSLLGMALLDSELIKLLLTVFNFLEVFQGSSEFSEVFSQCLVFKGELVDFSLLLIQMICDGFVFCVEIELSLNSMVFLVEEVNLILQLRDGLLVYFLLVLHAELLHVLSTIVETAKPQDLIVSGFD